MTARSGRSGVLVVDKAAGLTSFQVVARLKGVLRPAKIGHGGTLDPSATGVLPILIGEATKLMPYLLEQDKEYRAVVRLGVTTDTQDLTGRVLTTVPVPALSRSEVEHACAALVGTIAQVPPMYSAIHHEGRRLYELARQGVEVERPARPVVVSDIVVEDVASATVRLRIVCGKGTYVRALAADLGAALGVGGAVAELVRLRVGPFALGDAVPWAALVESGAPALWERVLPPDAILQAYPAVTLDLPAAGALLHGQTVETEVAGATGIVRVYARERMFIGVGRVVGVTRVKPERILHADHPGTRVLSV